MRWKLKRFYRRYLRCLFFRHKWVRRRRKIKFRNAFTTQRLGAIASPSAEHPEYFETFYEKCVYCGTTRPLVEEG